MRTGALSIAAAAVGACRPIAQEEDPVAKERAASPYDVALTSDQWRRKLTPEQYAICRDKGTEPPGSGRYLDHWEPGRYDCVACGNPLFASETKYEACGWPSFSDALPGAVRMEEGREAVCARCGSHLGHIFDDGPPPTGRRY